MQTAMNEATSRAITQMLLATLIGSGTSNENEVFLMLEVSRENIVNDTLSKLAQYETHDLKRPLKVSF